MSEEKHTPLPWRVFTNPDGTNAVPALVKALEEIKLLLSAAKNDDQSLAVKESNANHAWHAANTALAAYRKEA